MRAAESRMKHSFNSAVPSPCPTRTSWWTTSMSLAGRDSANGATCQPCRRLTPKQRHENSTLHLHGSGSRYARVKGRFGEHSYVFGSRPVMILFGSLFLRHQQLLPPRLQEQPCHRLILALRIALVQRLVLQTCSARPNDEHGRRTNARYVSGSKCGGEGRGLISARNSWRGDSKGLRCA